MRGKMIAVNLLLALVFAWQLVGLYRELNSPALAGPLASLADFPPVSKSAPELLPEYPSIFDLEPPKTTMAATEKADGEGSLTELASEKYTLRLRGIFMVEKGPQLAVIDVLDAAGKFKETIRAAAGQAVLDLMLTTVDGRTVTITRQDGEAIRLKIFDREDKAKAASGKG